MRNVRRAVASIALATTVACALPSADEFASGSRSADSGSSSGSSAGEPTRAPANDGAATSTGDAGPGHDAAADGANPDPVVNLLPEGSREFEGSCGDDSGAYQATLEPSTTARSGTGSCRVCRSVANTELWSIDTGLPDVMLAPGEVYHATAWVRRPPGSTDRLVVTIVVRSQAQNYAQIELHESDSVELTDDWQQLSTSLLLTKPAKRMDTYTYAVNADGIAVPCFLIDDYVVWR